jgi:predicted amidohydrolase YtcJ
MHTRTDNGRIYSLDGGVHAAVAIRESGLKARLESRHPVSDPRETKVIDLRAYVIPVSTTVICTASPAGS